MSENKRFEIREGHVKHIIENNHPRIPMMFANMDEICDRLNELYDENERLSQENDELIEAIIGKVQYGEDLGKFVVEKGLITKDWDRFDCYD